MIDMALMMDELLQKIVPLAESDPDIAVVWLYGSRAKGNAHASSDYDLAVAFNRFIKDDPIEQRLRPECLALDWQQALGLHDFQLSVVDINQAPIPLAWEIIQADTVIFCRDENRLWRETLRIHSRMELDYAHTYLDSIEPGNSSCYHRLNPSR
ncbi:type VII toxin-antitoxin system MntA family adenylyltransferase antitoxin [Methylomicrobium lacus]|uniref:type VII toxin-antitoxin system MntA family adenylyltransferase antitoxin n=1 Tax=Methylomicrobium lacus TaxID=136992 RepID=UPI001FDFD1D7|nr:nucleotidyltransferase domain-containing protein [Methylomicrobium lacus]